MTDELNRERIDDLNAQVTTAIIQAEHATHRGDPLAATQWALVSHIEEELAELLPADTVEGQVSRSGAVTAALAAQEPARATELFERYRAELWEAAVLHLRERMVTDG